ncbi:fumarate reductase subunit D [Halarchaeum rubridurum]|uniref:Fumarate reductase subunit D n=1 Tax=Halarchaeum rubridurum TaxID=489911 RepID=A0A830FTH6_9EURY|nr:hypothetical protein [Halarchaeum rubridurum]MBP1954281.1 fumarate reductase subunit D [Halarchaeum rubridurum]GGM58798.1 hypothetical protein GCM10009017_06150 [Halarchaeum rubridurum]
MSAPRDALHGALRDGLRVALNRPRTFGFAGGALLCEVVLRLALATVHPLLAVVCPPVVALPLLGATAPAVDAAVADPAATPALALRARLRERGPTLLALAVGGHLVALACGAAAFLLLDTPVRWAVYATGGTVSTVAVHVTPLVGVAVGAFLAWGLLAPAVARAASGDGVGVDVRAPLRALRDRRRTAAVLGLHLVCALVALGLFAACVALAADYYPTRTAALLSLGVAFASTVGALVLLGTLAYPIHVALARRGGPRPPSLSPKRVAVAALLLTTLVAGASAVRVTETRPTPDAGTGTAALPADATDAYAAALDRTAARDHRVTVRDAHEGRALVSTTTVERTDRRIRTVVDTGDGDPTVGYADSGVVYGLAGFSPGLFALGERHAGDWKRARALPGYWYLRDEYAVTDGFASGLPEPHTGAWTTVNRTDGVRTVALTDDAAVFDALLDVEADDASVRSGRVRMRLDTERGVVLGGSARLNATLGDHDLVRNRTYDAASGPGVEAPRPDTLGARSPGEWLWDVFAY